MKLKFPEVPEEPCGAVTTAAMMVLAPLRWVLALIFGVVALFVVMAPVERFVRQLVSVGMNPQDVWEESERFLVGVLKQHPVLWALSVNLSGVPSEALFREFQLGVAKRLKHLGLDVEIDA